MIQELRRLPGHTYLKPEPGVGIKDILKEVKLTGGVAGQKPLGRTDRGPVDLVQAQSTLQRWHGGTWPLLGMGAGVGGGCRNWREMLQFQGGRAQLAWD